MGVIKRLFKNKLVPQVIFIISGIGLLFIFSAIGAEMPLMKFDAQIMAISELTRDDTITNITLDKVDDNSVKCNDVTTIVRYFNQYKDRFRPYCKVNNNYEFKLDDFSCNTTICNLTYYYDFDYTEYCHLPLFLTAEPMMRKGPLYGADFASYIPSSIADRLLAKLSLDNYNQLLESHLLYTIELSHNIVTFSVNNIYLNEPSANWGKEEKDKYYRFFGKRNHNAILIASANLIDTQSNTEFCFDTNPGYGNLDKIIRKCNTTLGEKLDYKITNKDGHIFSSTILTSGLRGGFYSKNQAPYFIAGILTLFIQSVFLLYAEVLIKGLLKNIITLVSVYFVIGTAVEILKVTLISNYSIFYFFNYIGAVISLIYILILFIVYLIISIRADKKNDKKIV